MHKNIYFQLILFLFICINQVSLAEEIIAPGSVIRPEDASKPAYSPGWGWGGVPLSDSQLYEIPPEKCTTQGIAEIIKEYYLTDKIYLFKTDNGYGVAELSQTLKEIETGVRRRKNCSIAVGLKLNGEVDCKGVRVIKSEPYEGCAYEAKIFAHSLTEAQAFQLIYTKLQNQFKTYKDKCVLPPPPKSLQDRMIKF